MRTSNDADSPGCGPRVTVNRYDPGGIIPTGTTAMIR